jgi:hypothetical protein
MALSKKKKEFIEILKKQMFHISNACNAFGIERKTYYNWLNSSEEFKETVENERRHMVDTAESMLYKNVLEGKEKSIMEFLKHNYPERYGDKQTVSLENKDGHPFEIKQSIKVGDKVIEF